MTGFRLLLLAIFTTGSVLQADVEVSRPQLTKPPGGQFQAAVASSGDDFLAVWVETNSDAHVRAARIGADGTALDPTSTRITASGRFTPDAVWNGSTYLIAWERTSRSYVATFSRSGELGEEQPMFSAPVTLPQLASSTSGTIAVGRHINGIRIAALDQTGSPIAEREIPALMFDGAMVTPLGENFLVVWNESRVGGPAVSAAVVSPRAEIVGAPRIVSARGWASSVAGVGETALVLYREIDPSSFEDAGRSRELLARVVTSASVSEPLVIERMEDAAIYESSVAAHDGQFLVTWMRKVAIVDVRPGSLPPPFVPTYDLHTATVSANGSVLDRRTLIESENSDEFPVIASNGRNLLVSWMERSILEQRQRIAAALLDGLSVSRTVELTKSAPNQTSPRIVEAGEIRVVVWEEDPENSGRASIYARRLSKSGRFLDAEPILVSSGHVPSTDPCIASSKSETLIAWTDRAGKRVIGRRLKHDGTLIDDPPMVLASTAGTPCSAASDGDQFLVISASGGSNPFAVVDADGAHPRSRFHGFEIGSGTTSMAWTGSRYLLVWSVVMTTNDGDQTFIRGTWLTRDGAPQIVTSFNISEGVADGVMPSVGCSSASCVAAWTTSDGIAAARISGDVVTQLGIVSGRRSTGASVAGTETDVLVSWNTFEEPFFSVFGLTVRDFGTPAPAARLLGPTGSQFVSYAAVPTPNGPVVAYQVMVEGPQYGGASRIFIRSPLGDGRRRAASH